MVIQRFFLLLFDKVHNTMPRLKLIISENISEIFRLSEDSTIGRTNSSNIILLDPSISRRHCRIFQQEGQYYLEDLGSGNGTFLNGTKVIEPMELNTDDILTIGNKDVIYDGFDIDLIPPLHTVDLTKKPLASFKDEVLIESEDVLFIIPTIEPLMEMIYEIATRNIFESKLTEQSQDLFVPSVIEAIKNGAEHGNKYSISKLLKFRCVKNEKRVVVQITDQGTGFDWKEKLEIGFEILKDQKRYDLFVNGEVEAADPYMGKIGRGLLLMMKHVPSVEFNQEGNSIILTHLIFNSGTYRVVS